MQRLERLEKNSSVVNCVVSKGLIQSYRTLRLALPLRVSPLGLHLHPNVRERSPSGSENPNPTFAFPLHGHREREEFFARSLAWKNSSRKTFPPLVPRSLGVSPSLSPRRFKDESGTRWIIFLATDRCFSRLQAEISLWFAVRCESLRGL